jgi:hypothetical protein
MTFKSLFGVPMTSAEIQRRYREKHRIPRIPGRPDGTLRAIINAAKLATGLGLADLTVLSPAVDPYRIDTGRNHKMAQWFLEQVNRLIPDDDATIHLRGLHYRISSAGEVLKTEGFALQK